MELLPCASADVKLVQVIYARALTHPEGNNTTKTPDLRPAFSLLPVPSRGLVVAGGGRGVGLSILGGKHTQPAELVDGGEYGHG